DRGHARGFDVLGVRAVDLAKSDDHPTAIARDFERLHAALGHGEKERELGGNRLAVLTKLGPAAADYLDRADIRTGLAGRGRKVLAAFDGLDDRARLVASDF